MRSGRSGGSRRAGGSSVDDLERIEDYNCLEEAFGLLRGTSTLRSEELLFRSTIQMHILPFRALQAVPCLRALREVPVDRPVQEVQEVRGFRRDQAFQGLPAVRADPSVREVQPGQEVQAGTFDMAA